MKKTIKREAAKYLVKLEKTNVVCANMEKQTAATLGKIAKASKAFKVGRIHSTEETVLVRTGRIKKSRECKKGILFCF